MLNREQKTKIIDYLEKLCETSRISKKTLGNTIRSYHVSCPFVVLILLFFGSQLCVTISAINLIFVFGMFVITNGCLLTMLEHRLCGDEFTIADPFIETLGIELNSKNRVNISYCIAISYLLFFFLVYYYRFIFKKKISAAINSVKENDIYEIRYNSDKKVFTNFTERFDIFSSQSLFFLHFIVLLINNKLL